MNEKIKFRGKVLYNGNHYFSGGWVKGFYYENRKGEAFIIDVEPDDLGNARFAHVQVDLETITQYAGLKDKNDKEVYVGDIVNCSSGCPHNVVWKMDHGGTIIGGMPTIYLAGLNDGYSWSGTEEIMGNINENN